jgi:hypothetical protein
MTKEQTVDLLKSQLPGFYSAEQVINLIEKIEVSPKVTPEVLREIENDIIRNLERDNDNSRLVDEDDIELEFGRGREIEISNVHINFDVIRDAISEGLQNAFSEDND